MTSILILPGFFIVFARFVPTVMGQQQDEVVVGCSSADNAFQLAIGLIAIDFPVLLLFFHNNRAAFAFAFVFEDATWWENVVLFTIKIAASASLLLALLSLAVPLLRDLKRMPILVDVKLLDLSTAAAILMAVLVAFMVMAKDDLIQAAAAGARNHLIPAVVQTCNAVLAQWTYILTWAVETSATFLHNNNGDKNNKIPATLIVNTNGTGTTF